MPRRQRINASTCWSGGVTYQALGEPECTAGKWKISMGAMTPLECRRKCRQWMNGSARRCCFTMRHDGGDAARTCCCSPKDSRHRCPPVLPGQAVLPTSAFPARRRVGTRSDPLPPAKRSAQSRPRPGCRIVVNRSTPSVNDRKCATIEAPPATPSPPRHYDESASAFRGREVSLAAVVVHGGCQQSGNGHDTAR